MLKVSTNEPLTGEESTHVNKLLNIYNFASENKIITGLLTKRHSRMPYQSKPHPTPSPLP